MHETWLLKFLMCYLSWLYFSVNLFWKNWQKKLISPTLQNQSHNLTPRLRNKVSLFIMLIVKSLLEKKDTFALQTAWLEIKQETLRVVTIAMTCSTLASLWKFQYFRRSIYNPVEHLWWSFYCKNNKPLSIFTKNLHRRCSLGF